MTPVSEHITAVTAALCAASGGEHPLPEVLEGVLEYTYLQKGWRCSDIAHFDSHRPWPTLQESLANVDVWMQKMGSTAQKSNKISLLLQKCVCANSAQAHLPRSSASALV